VAPPLQLTEVVAMFSVGPVGLESKLDKVVVHPALVTTSEYTPPASPEIQLVVALPGVHKNVYPDPVPPTPVAQILPLGLAQELGWVTVKVALSEFV
jgi:hypothetical protein